MNFNDILESPCPFCGKRVKFEDIKFTEGALTLMQLKCPKCESEFTLNAGLMYTYSDDPILTRDLIELWNGSRYDAPEYNPRKGNNNG